MDFGLMISLSGLIAKVSKDILDIKSNLDKEKYNNYILPIWEAFKLVHKDYKESFIKYAERVEDGKSLDDLIIEIQQDSVYSQDLRDELSNIINVLTEEELKNEKLSLFLRGIRSYLYENSSFTIDNGMGPIFLFYTKLNCNEIRRTLIAKLSALNADKVKLSALNADKVYSIKWEKSEDDDLSGNKRGIIYCINDHLSNLQCLYGETSKDFHELMREII